MSIDLTQIEALGTQPIPGPSPGGINIQDDDDFAQIERNFMALISIEGTGGGGNVKPLGGPGEANWLDVGNMGIKILRERSKNLRVAAFLMVALFEENGLPGLAEGIKLADNLLKNFWETMFPPLKLLKGRTSAIEFVATRIAGEGDAPGGMLSIRGQKVLNDWRAVQDSNPSKSGLEAGYEELKRNYDRLQDAKKALESLKLKIYEVFPQDKLPTITSLTEVIKDLDLNIGEEVSRNKPKEAAPAGEAGVPGVVSAAAPRPAAAGPAVSASNPDEARKALVRLAPILRDADPSDPAAYRIARIGVWSSLTALPPVKEGNTTRVPAGIVNKGLIEAATNLVNTSNWMVLLNQSEPRFPNCPLWLDQQRHIHRALKGMGAAFEPAARAVADETSNLLRRLPGLQSLTFDGGTPFADAETQRWIDTEVFAAAADGGGSRSSMPSGGSADGAAGLDEALVEARDLAGKGKLADALRLLQGGPKGSVSMRGRFLWRMALARLAQESGKTKVTQPMWESLLADIERYNLEVWEPELCVPVLHELYRICKSDKTQADRAETLYGRLCRVDVGAALSLEK